MDPAAQPFVPPRVQAPLPPFYAQHPAGAYQQPYVPQQPNPFIELLNNPAQAQQLAPPVNPFIQPQWGAAPRPNKVNLTDFWPKQAEAWFNFAEGQCHDAGIFESRAIFNACLKALPTTLVEDLGPLLRAAPTLPDPFAQLRAEVVRRHTPCVQELLNNIVFSPELGGRPPSELMRSLLLSLPVGEPAGLLFKHLFVLKLPADLQEAVGRRLTELDPAALAEYADQRWHLRNSGKAPTAAGIVAALDELSLDSSPDIVAAVSSHKQHPSGKKKQKQKRPGDSTAAAAPQAAHKKPDAQYFCRFHVRYGVAARNCADPQFCQFQGNGGAGGN